MTTARPDSRIVALHNILRRCDLFVGLSNDDLNQIAQLTVLKSLDRGEYLFHEGEPSKGFYIVQSGGICVHRVNAAGKEQVIYVFRPGQTFAEASLATEGGYPAGARATEPTTVLLVQKAGFVDLLKHRPELALRMLASMAIHLRTLVGQLEDLTMKDVETRLANWLLKQLPAATSSAPLPQTITLTGTKRALAAELGTVSETFSRTLAKLRELELIEVDGPRIHVRNPDGLRALLRRNLGE